MKRLSFILAILICSAFVYADVIYLKNGRSFDGEIIEETDTTVTIKENLGKYGFATSRYDKTAIERIERTSKGEKAQTERADKVATKQYKIVKEESTTHKAVVGKLSSYSSKELEKLPTVIRKEYRIVVPEGLSQTDIKNTVKNMIDKQLEENKDIDEMMIFVYDDERDAGGMYTVGRAVWGVDGKFGNVTPEIAKTNDKSKHKITFHIKTKERTSSNKPTDRELKIYYAHHKALWEDVTVPEKVVASRTGKKFGITPEEVDRIYTKVSIWKLKRK